MIVNTVAPNAIPDDETDMADRGGVVSDPNDYADPNDPLSPPPWNSPQPTLLLPAQAQSASVEARVGEALGKWQADAATVPLKVAEAPPAAVAEGLSAVIKRLTIQTKDSECWGWAGPRDALGRPVVRSLDTAFFAQRMAWAAKNGAIPDGMTVYTVAQGREDACEVVGCMNPAHMKLRTLGEGEDRWPRVWASQNINDETLAQDGPATSITSLRAGAAQGEAGALAGGATTQPKSDAGTSSGKSPSTAPTNAGKPTANAAANQTSAYTHASRPKATIPYPLGGPERSGGKSGSSQPRAGAAGLGMLRLRGKLRSQSEFNDSRPPIVSKPSNSYTQTNLAPTGGGKQNTGTASNSTVTSSSTNSRSGGLPTSSEVGTTATTTNWQAQVYGGMRGETARAQTVAKAPQAGKGGEGAGDKPAKPATGRDLPGLAKRTKPVALVLTQDENIAVGKMFSVSRRIGNGEMGEGLSVTRVVRCNNRRELIEAQRWLADDRASGIRWYFEGQEVLHFAPFFPRDDEGNIMPCPLSGEGVTLELLGRDGKHDTATEGKTPQELLGMLDALAQRTSPYIEEVSFGKDSSKSTGAMYVDHDGLRTIHTYKTVLSGGAAREISGNDDPVEVWSAIEPRTERNNHKTWHSRKYLTRGIVRRIAIGRLINQISPDGPEPDVAGMYAAKDSEIARAVFRVAAIDYAEGTHDHTPAALGRATSNRVETPAFVETERTDEGTAQRVRVLA